MRKPGSGSAFYHGWTIVGVTILSQIAANSLTYNAFSLFVADWSRDLATPVSTLMLCIVALIWVAAALSPFVGALADRIPVRRLFAAGLAGMAVFFFAASLTTAGWQLVALYALVCSPALVLCTAVTSNAVISRWFVRRLGLALGLSSFGIGLGGVLIPPLVALVLPTLGWRGIWQAGGVILLVIVLPIVVVVLRDRPVADEGAYYLTAAGAGAARPPVHGHAPSEPGTLTARAILTRRNFLLLAAIYVPLTGIAGACVQNIAPIAASKGLDIQTAGLLLSMASAAHVLATLVTGLLCDRYGTRPPLVGLALTCALGVALIAIAPAGWTLAIAIFLAGVGTGVFTPLATGVAEEFGAQNFGRAFGLMMLFLPLSSPFAYALARTEELIGSYTPALVTYAAILTVTAGLALMLRKPAGHDFAAAWDA